MKSIRTMGIVRLATERRVTIAMLTLAIVIFGFVSASRLKMNLLPELSYPTLTVRTELPGAAPQEVENLITKPIEEAVGVIKNVRTVRSISRAGQSDVVLEFAWGTNMDYAGVDVREKLDVLTLPQQAERPLILRFDPSTEPVMRFALMGTPASLKKAQGSKLSDEARLKYLRRFADDQLTKELESVAGVAAVKVSGGLEDEIQVLVDQDKLAQLNLPIQTVIQRLQAENVNLSGGRLEQGNQKYLVRTINEFKSVEDIGNAVIAIRDNGPVYLHDIATVRHGYKERQAITRMDSHESVEVAIYKEGDANTVRVAQAVDKELTKFDKRLPTGLEMRKIYDQSTFISGAIDQVINAALIGGLLAALVLYFFLRNVAATAIITLSIPVSVIATFNAMYSTDITLNIMSLGGIALAVGMLVDNSIVVLENIARHRSMGKGVLQATREGTSEVGTAIIASTLTTVAVFFPLVFVQGVAGQLFRDQSLTVTFALLFSLLMALTLIPMLAALGARGPSTLEVDGSGTNPARAEPRNRFTRGMYRFAGWIAKGFSGFTNGLLWVFIAVGRATGKTTGFVINPFVGIFQRGFDRVEAFYPHVIRWALANRATVIAIAVSSLLVSFVIIPHLGVELIPQLSQGEFQVKVKLPPGTPILRTDSMVNTVQQIAAKIPDVATTYSVAGTGNRLDANPAEAGENIGTVNVVLKHGSGREQEERVMDALRAQLNKLPGLEYKFERPALFSFKTPLEVEVVGYDLDTLQKISNQIAGKMQQNHRFADVKSSMEAGHPEIQIRFDQAKLAQLGLTEDQVAQTVVDKVRGDVATRFTWRDRKIDVLVRNRANQRASLADVESLVINPLGAHPVPLSAVAAVQLAMGPSEIRRVGQERVAIVSANLRYGDLGTAATEVQGILDHIPQVPGVFTRVSGQNEEMQASFRSMQFALALAVFLVYLVMASQFESLIHPLIILLSVPLAMVGAVVALFVTDTTISVVVFIGLIMLAGIVVNNAIVLVDLVNQLRARGEDKLEAIVEAGRARLRPILMTTLTTTLGLAPMALGIGDGAEIRAPMAITVIGGLLSSTLLTLVVIPVAYAIVDRKVIVKGDEEAQGETAEAEV